MEQGYEVLAASFYDSLALFTVNPMVNLVEFQISVQDDQAINETLIDSLAHLAMDLESQNAVVTSAQPRRQSAGTRNLTHANKGSRLLNVEVNLETFQPWSQLFYEHLIGIPTTVNFQCGDLAFVFQKQYDPERQPTDKNFVAFVSWMESVTRASKG